MDMTRYQARHTVKGRAVIPLEQSTYQQFGGKGSLGGVLAQAEETPTRQLQLTLKTWRSGRAYQAATKSQNSLEN